MPRLSSATVQFPCVRSLYLLLVTVGDENGLSYYSDGSVGRLLSLKEEEVAAARRQLIAAGMITYEEPLYQVLALGDAEPVGAPDRDRKGKRP